MSKSNFEDNMFVVINGVTFYYDPKGVDITEVMDKLIPYSVNPDTDELFYVVYWDYDFNGDKFLVCY
jgi:hypothetical protein